MFSFFWAESGTENKLDETGLPTKISPALKIKVRFEAKKQTILVAHSGVELATSQFSRTILANVHVSDANA